MTFGPIRFAQRRPGQKMHIVHDVGGDYVASRAACGAVPVAGTWRMTCNMPLAHLCHNCGRVKSYPHPAVTR